MSLARWSRRHWGHVCSERAQRMALESTGWCRNQTKGLCFQLSPLRLRIHQDCQCTQQKGANLVKQLLSNANKVVVAHVILFDRLAVTQSQRSAGLLPWAAWQIRGTPRADPGSCFKKPHEPRTTQCGSAPRLGPVGTGPAPMASEPGCSCRARYMKNFTWEKRHQQFWNGCKMSWPTMGGCIPMKRILKEPLLAELNIIRIPTACCHM